MRLLCSMVALVLAAGCGQTAARVDADAGSGGASPVPETPPTVCNGHAELCGRAYDDVTFPGTHDAYATLAGGYLAADQAYSMSRQLEDGVRVLHLEIQPNQDDGALPSLCHGSCVLGSQRLVDGLTEIRGFVAAHPAELVTLLMETTNVTTDAVADALTTSGLGVYVSAQALGAPWPTLGASLAKGHRVVAFLVADGGASYPFLLDRWSFTWETPWDNETLADFRRCDADRGTMGNEIYVVDTYLEDLPVETAADNARVNYDPFLIDRLLLCRETTKRRPNFAMMDFYEVGDVFAAVDILNGFAPTPAFDAADFPPGAPDGGAGDGGE